MSIEPLRHLLRVLPLSRDNETYLIAAALAAGCVAQRRTELVLQVDAIILPKDEYAGSSVSLVCMESAGRCCNGGRCYETEADATKRDRVLMADV